MHTGAKQSSASVGRSLTIAELTARCQPLAPLPNVAGQQSAFGRSRSSGSNSTHSTDTVNSRIRSGPRHGRTVVQMLQNSLVQKALNQEMAASNSGSDCSKIIIAIIGIICQLNWQVNDLHMHLSVKLFSIEK